MRTGTAISVIAHFGILTACLILTGVKPFDSVTPETIAVEIVPADEMPLPSEMPQPAEPADMAAPQPAAESAASSAASSQGTPQDPKPASQEQATSPQPEVPTAQPDITSRFGMMFTMPESGSANDFDAKATAAANIKLEDAAALRAHLKTCSILPRSVSPDDNVRIVLRVAFERDGRLAREPLLIEASASEKGPALMKSAMTALEKCQPYAMLPADRYNEWRMLDLSFTPKDFRGG